LVYEKNANFFAKNWQKLQKIVIIIDPGCRVGSSGQFLKGAKAETFILGRKAELPDGLFSNQKSRFG
jgi:hypothetical protein